MNRRTFLKGAAAAGGAIAAVAGAPSTAEARRETNKLPPNAVGMLYDATLCIGCQACVAACKRVNDVPINQPDELKAWNEGTWDTNLDLGPKTFNVIKAYQHGTMEKKDRAENGFSFIKRSCLHCVDPSCVSACPVSAMKKDADNGIVSYNPDACIGCRYCVYACPFGVPRFEYDTPTPQIRKCEFCRHEQAENRLPGCVDVCPTGATLFGPVVDLRKEAERRLAAQPGQEMEMPRGDVTGNVGGKRPSFPAKVGEYQKNIYGDTELGGTQVNYLSGVPFDKLGLPTDVPDHSYASISEGIQHTVYKGMMAPAALLAGLSFLAYRSTKNGHGDDES